MSITLHDSLSLVQVADGVGGGSTKEREAATPTRALAAARGDGLSLSAKRKTLKSLAGRMHAARALHASEIPAEIARDSR